MIILGVVLIVLGLLFGTGSAISSRSDWAWNHRHAPWSRGGGVSETRKTQSAVWLVASIVAGGAIVAVGVVALFQ